MATVSSMAELEALIKGAVEEGLKDVGEAGEKIVQQQIESDVYGLHSPVKYERTYQLKESVTHEVNGLEVEIKHDGLGGYFSVVPGYSANSSLIPELVHNSGAPNIFGGAGGTWTGGRPYMENAKAEVESQATEALKSALSSKGFNIG